MPYTSYRIKLEDALDVLIDYRGKTPKKSAEGIPLVTAKIIKNGFVQEPTEFISENIYEKWMTRGFPKENDVLLTTEAPLGEVALLKNTKIALAQRIILLRGKKNVLNNFYLYYFLRSPDGQNRIKEKGTGTTVVGIKQSELRKMLIDLPDYHYQIKVSNFLSNHDALVQNNTKRLRVLEEITQSLYKEWFVNFRFPGHEKVKMIDSELGNIPEGWTIEKMGDLVVRFTAGKKYDNRTVKLTGKVPVLDQGQTGVIGFHNEEPGFVASWDNPVIVFANHTCYQKIVSYPFSAIQNVIPFKPMNKTMDILWLHYSSKDLIKLNDYKGHWPEYMSKKLVVPNNLDITATFGSLIRPILKEIELLEKRNTNISKTRDLLIPKLISGEIDVSEMDI